MISLIDLAMMEGEPKRSAMNWLASMEGGLQVKEASYTLGALFTAAQRGKNKEGERIGAHD